MSQKKTATVGHFEPPHGTLQSYIAAFIACILISLIAYVMATSNAISNQTAIAIIAGLAIIQAVIQLQYFLHVGDEYKPRWKLWIFVLMVTIAAIVVGGSLWIMDNLNYRMIHSSDQVQEYVESQDGL